MNSSNTDNRKINLTTYMLIVCAISAVLIVFTEGFFGIWLEMIFPKNEWPNINMIGEQGHSLIGYMGKLLFFTSVAILVFRKAALSAWDNTLGVFVRGIDQKVTTLAGDIRDYFHNPDTAVTVDKCFRIDDYKRIMLPPCKELYGKHIGQDGSLFAFVQKVYLDSFSKAPHPSNVKKNITIQKHPDLNGYMKWRDVTNYDIHHVAHGTTTEPGKYLLRFLATSFAPDLEETKWAESMKVVLRVDDQPIVSPTDVPEYKKESHADGFYCWKKGNWITIRFQKLIELHKERTPVQCEEVSLNSIMDKVYTLHSDKPICGYSLEVTLPDDMKFLRDPFVSPKIVYSGLSDSAKQVLPRNTIVQYSSDAQIWVGIKEWVMPGIVLNLNWIETEQR